MWSFSSSLSDHFAAVRRRVGGLRRDGRVRADHQIQSEGRSGTPLSHCASLSVCPSHSILPLLLLCPCEGSFLSLSARHQFDLLFARLPMSSIPDDIDMLDDNMLRNMDEKSVLALNGTIPAQKKKML
jgi:hypothetical protein